MGQRTFFSKSNQLVQIPFQILILQTKRTYNKNIRLESNTETQKPVPQAAPAFLISSAAPLHPTCLSLSTPVSTPLLLKPPPPDVQYGASCPPEVPSPSCTLRSPPPKRDAYGALPAENYDLLDWHGCSIYVERDSGSETESVTERSRGRLVLLFLLAVSGVHMLRLQRRLQRQP